MDIKVTQSIQRVSKIRICRDTSGGPSWLIMEFLDEDEATFKAVRIGYDEVDIEILNEVE